MIKSPHRSDFKRLGSYFLAFFIQIKLRAAATHIDVDVVLLLVEK